MLHLYNTLTKQLEPFEPLSPNEVKMYNCGPTVYNFAHIGNLSSYIMADLIRRYLEYKGYTVKQIMNITDVGHLVSDSDSGEDKMEKAAREEKKDIWEIARSYESAFHDDRKKLRLLDAHEYPRATDWVEAQLSMVQKLVETGHAYETSDGIYFSVETFPNYGQLSGNSLSELSAGQRVEINEDKRHPADFALWKYCVGENSGHVMRWDSKTGAKLAATVSPSNQTPNTKHQSPMPGFPGWHIECSAMATALLGSTIDIHTGGEDNIFPHHECEIAQSESVSGQKFCNTWIHKRHIFVDGEKMSKSKKNFFTLSDLESKGHNPLAYRYLILSVHYRQNTNFTLEGLKAAQKNIDRLQTFLEAVQNANDSGPKVDVAKARSEFESCLNDDLNTSGALSAVFDLVRTGNTALQISSPPAKGEMPRLAGQRGSSGGIKNRLDVLKFLKDFDSVFAVLSWDVEMSADPQIEVMVKKRDDLRSIGHFAEADAVRDELLAQGIELVDTKNGTKWKTKH